MHQFSVGEVVTWIPDLLLRSESHGDYRIVASMPDRDGDHMYRIKSPLEEYERVVKEDLLVKSKGYLPEQVLKPGAGDQSHCPRCRRCRGRGPSSAEASFCSSRSFGRAGLEWKPAPHLIIGRANCELLVIGCASDAAGSPL